MSPRKGPFQIKSILQSIIFEGTCQFSKEYSLHSHPFKGQRYSSWYDHYQIYQHEFCKKIAWKSHHFCQDVPPNFPLPSAAFFPRAFLPHFSTWLSSHGNVFTLATEASRGWRLGGPTLNLEVLTSICLFPQRSLMFFVFACVDLWVFVEDNVLVWWTIEELISLSQEGVSPSASFLSYPLFCTAVLTMWVQLHISYMNNTKKSRLSSSVEVEKFHTKSKFFK